MQQYLVHDAFVPSPGTLVNLSCPELHWSCSSDLDQILRACGLGWVKITVTHHSFKIFLRRRAVFMICIWNMWNWKIWKTWATFTFISFWAERQGKLFSSMDEYECRKWAILSVDCGVWQCLESFQKKLVDYPSSECVNCRENLTQQFYTSALIFSFSTDSLTPGNFLRESHN